MQNDTSPRGQPSTPRPQQRGEASGADAVTDPAMELYIRMLAEKADDSLDRASAARETTDRLIATYLEQHLDPSAHRAPIPTRRD